MLIYLDKISLNIIQSEIFAYNEFLKYQIYSFQRNNRHSSQKDKLQKELKRIIITYLKILSKRAHSATRPTLQKLKYLWIIQLIELKSKKDC